VDFRNTIVIMTSNIGTRQLKDFGQGVGFTTKTKQETSNEYTRSVIQNALKKAFSPEFLNRIDDVVIFNTLTREDIHKIIDIELKGLYARIIAMGFNLRLSDAAKDYIAEKGYDIQFGARPLKRAIQKYLEDPMAEVIIRSNMKAGDTIAITFNKKKETVDMKVIRTDDASSAEAIVDESEEME
jgi:ATP-dependent Clp protease ATP-binding subunit ClpC